MKYIDEFRDGELARGLAAAIERAARVRREYRFMEFCGGHTHAIARYGVSDLLPPGVRMIHGPGCPVCVLPIGRIDMAIRLALEAGVILCSYGDPLRVPASHGQSLLRAKATLGRPGSTGGEIRMVYSCADALTVAQQQPARQVVFFAIGFETTTPPTAVVIKQAQALGLRNFSVLCCHVLTPSAIASILESPEVRQWGSVPLDGFVGPAHVSTIIGTRPYEFFAEEYRKPVVIAGFEPLDVLQAILMLIEQVNAGRACVENQFRRAVTREGNLKAQQVVAEVFELRRSFAWRGLGELPYSALRIRSNFAEFDAERRFSIDYQAVPDHPACECGAILRGVKRPAECRIFGSVCTPENPIGSCMVSAEGACAAHYSYGRLSGQSLSQPPESAVSR
ncbi:MAG TPA: hydrogenase formation protein HypD [Accumulibacter sp.]|uniref:hydrogenase formation protein HypD n=1 Tax=Accumulibacter sp. TaxID=2053492 RepID=UPI002C0DC1F4|nr:hydrogenase formation protein HypD [Accumulibacter sp.]HMV04273.1 hydrogenase formation protein HypD [Accumulibacter sp.]HMW62976.1 hydrogenase formation protein HypD [Accumulibacter sp.]HNH91687.1 hydrogenase formation protein HypD [Accumulibacter sp.]HNI50904.1 hydrogenase formation protein HypD [Accumulibacter sp.]HNL95659.1 hydrogenase formation protein HypD [Accumulibacter sp.]